MQGTAALSYAQLRTQRRRDVARRTGRVPEGEIELDDMDTVELQGLLEGVIRKESANVEARFLAQEQHFDKILGEKDKAIQAALAAAKEAVNAALVATQKAVDKAELNSEKWRENANEWRGAMTDRESRFVSRPEYEEWKKGVDNVLTGVTVKASVVEGKGLGLHAGWGYLMGAIGAIATLVSIFYALSK